MPGSTVRKEDRKMARGVHTQALADPVTGTKPL